MAFAPNGFHWADANTNYDLDTAMAMAPKLANLGLKGLKSPLPPNRIRAYQTLKRQGALPILMDEGIVSPVEVGEFIALDMFDGVAMKVARCGGLWNASRIARLLQENDLLLFASGLTDPELSMAATAHFFAWAGLDFPPRSTVRNTSSAAVPWTRRSAPAATSCPFRPGQAWALNFPRRCRRR